MKTLARIIVTIAATATFAACAVEPETADDRGVVAQVWEIGPGQSAPAVLPPVPMSADVLLLDDPGTGDAEPGVCQCETAECELALVEETFGCGVCAQVTCGERLVGGCVACPDDGIVAETERGW